MKKDFKNPVARPMILSRTIIWVMCVMWAIRAITASAQVTNFVKGALLAELDGGDNRSREVNGGTMVSVDNIWDGSYAEASFVGGNAGFRGSAFFVDNHDHWSMDDDLLASGGRASFSFSAAHSVTASVSWWVAVRNDLYVSELADWRMSYDGTVVFSPGSILNLPTNLLITAGTHTFAVEGRALPGAYFYNVDSAGLGVSITYGVPDPTPVSPTISPGDEGITNDLPDGTNRQDYAYAFTMYGNPAPTASLSSGRLPSGLDLTAGGAITGAPSEFGLFTFKVRAENGVTPADAKTYRLRILPRVTMLGVEVNQSIQTLGLTVPHVAGKRTMARVHVQSPDAATEMVVVDGVLHGRTLADVPLPDSPLSPRSGFVDGALAVTNLGIAEAALLDTTLNFHLPTSWTRQDIILRPELLGVAQTNADFGRGADPYHDGEVWVQFYQQPTVNLHFVPVTMDNDTPSNLPPNADDLIVDALQLEFAFPVASLNWTVQPGIRFDSSKLTNELDLDALLSDISMYWALTDKPARDLFYGTFNTSKNLGGLAQSDDNTKSVAAGKYDSNHPGIFLHEVAHLLGQPHATSSNLFGYGPCGAFTNSFGIRGACGECTGVKNQKDFPFFLTNAAGTVFAALGSSDKHPAFTARGLNLFSAEPTVYAHNQTVELMSYCFGAIPGFPEWVSLTTYESLFSKIEDRFQSPTPALRRTLSGDIGTLNATNGWYMIVRGSINVDSDDVELENLHRVYRTHPIEPATNGAYTLELRNAADALLASYPFDPDHGSEGTLIVQPFLVAVPDHPDLRRVTVSKSAQLKDEITASLHAPSVVVLSPNGGEMFAGEAVTVSWAGADLDGDPLVYTIFFSADDGATWSPVGIDVPGESYEIPRAYLPGTTQGLVRVVAGDGFWTSTDESDAVFSTSFHAPVVRLIAGNTNEPLRVGGSAWFEVTAYDVEDGLLSESNVVWSSDRDGVFAAGTTALTEWTNRSVGVHAITVTATDSHGMTSAHTFPVDVIAMRPALVSTLKRTTEQSILIEGITESPNELVVEVSTNLMTWRPVYTTLQEQAVFTITGLTASNLAMESFRVVTRPPNLPPTALITSPSNSPLGVTPGQPFTAAAVINDPNGDPLSVTWNIRDVSNQVVATTHDNPSEFILNDPGLYLLQLLVTDPSGAYPTGKLDRTVRVNLGAGAIAFTGYNGDGDDHLAFVAIVDIPPNLEIFLSDNEWNGQPVGDGGNFTDNEESILKWTAPAAGLVAGTVVLINGIETTAPLTTSTGSILYASSVNVGVGSGGDAFFAYLGTKFAPQVFLAAVASGPATVFGNLNGTGLALGTNAIAIGSTGIFPDIMAYNGPRVGSSAFADYLQLIHNPATWITEDGSGSQHNNGTPPEIPFVSTLFSITP